MKNGKSSQYDTMANLTQIYDMYRNKCILHTPYASWSSVHPHFPIFSALLCNNCGKSKVVASLKGKTELLVEASLF